MTLTEPTAWPQPVARTCANGDGRPTLVTVHGVPLCGKCALAAMQDRDVQDAT